MEDEASYNVIAGVLVGPVALKRSEFRWTNHPARHAKGGYVGSNRYRHQTATVCYGDLEK
jgi:hypothetical protein